MRFSLAVDGDQSLRQIFPSKQADTQKAITLARADGRIQRLIVFGSAVTMDCGTGSDLDLAVDAPGVREDEFGKLARQFYLGIPSEVDVIHYNTIQNPMLKAEIDRKAYKTCQELSRPKSIKI